MPREGRGRVDSLQLLAEGRQDAALASEGMRGNVEPLEVAPRRLAGAAKEASVQHGEQDARVSHGSRGPQGGESSRGREGSAVA